MIERLRVPFQAKMATRLVLGFTVLTLLTLAAMLTTIGTMMRSRMMETVDTDLSHHAQTYQAVLQEQEKYLEAEALLAANLEGMSSALAAKDAPELTQLLTPVLASHDFDTIYIIYQNGGVILNVGAPLLDSARIQDLPLVERAFESGRVSGPLTLNDGLAWAGGAVQHLLQDQVLVLIVRRLDQRYLRLLHNPLGPHVILNWQDQIAACMDVPSPELSASRLQNGEGGPGEPRDGWLTYYSIVVDDTPYRVNEFDFTTRDGNVLSAYLFQPMSRVTEVMSEAIRQVVGVSLLILVFGSALAFLYARGVTRPLGQLGRAAEAIALGDLEQPVPIKSRDEIGQVARAFEEMRVRVRAMLAQQLRWNAELEEKIRAKTGELQALCELRDKLLQQTITAQEDERRRVAHELHDETSQALTALLANLAAAEKLPCDEGHARLQELRAATVEILKEINRIVLDLRPTLLDDYGLLSALSWYAEQRLKPAGVNVEISTHGEELRLSSIGETILFRVGQEAIANIAKHANAQHVQINFSFANGTVEPTLTLEIQDDGIGFDVAHYERYTPGGRLRLGLIGMRERLDMVGGRCEIRSAPGQGTCVTAIVPLQQENRQGVDCE